MSQGPRQIFTPHPRLHGEIPAGMTAIEFFNSPCNLRHLAEQNGLLRTAGGFLLYRKLLGHSMEFDTSIILDSSNQILNPLGRPVRRDELSHAQKREWSRMSCTILQYMLEKYPDPARHLLLCGEASLDPTWPLSKPGVPSIRMIHNHFIVFPLDRLRKAPLADPDHPNLTDGGHHSLFLGQLSEVYRRFLAILDLRVVKPITSEEARLHLTGYPQGLPSWQIPGADSLADPCFWRDYDLILQGFLDFYRTFFGLVSRRDATIPKEAYFPEQVERILLFNNEFHQAAKRVRERILEDPPFANEIRWQPAYKQVLYRDDAGRLIVTISQNSVGNAITELLGIVVNRQLDETAYQQAEGALIEKLLEVRTRLIQADLGTPIATPAWPR